MAAPQLFDADAVELMRQLLAKAKHPGHLYPMAMCSWEIMPPPKKLEKHLGERRRTKHAGTGAQPGALVKSALPLTAVTRDATACGECAWVLMGLWEFAAKGGATGTQHAGTGSLPISAYVVCALNHIVSAASELER